MNLNHIIYQSTVHKSLKARFASEQQMRSGRGYLRGMHINWVVPLRRSYNLGCKLRGVNLQGGGCLRHSRLASLQRATTTTEDRELNEASCHVFITPDLGLLRSHELSPVNYNWLMIQQRVYQTKVQDMNNNNNNPRTIFILLSS